MAGDNTPQQSTPINHVNSALSPGSIMPWTYKPQLNEIISGTQFQEHQCPPHSYSCMICSDQQLYDMLQKQRKRKEKLFAGDIEKAQKRTQPESVQVYSTLPAAGESDLKIHPNDQDAITFHNQHTSPLLLLPPELRNLIYFHLFDSNEFSPTYFGAKQIALRTGPYGTACKTFKEVGELWNITKVCRQLRRETLMLPWRFSRYFVGHPGTFREWLETRSEEVREAVLGALEKQEKNKIEEAEVVVVPVTKDW